MSALIAVRNEAYRPLRRIALDESGKGKSEKWFQELLFANPGVIPIEDVHPGSSHFIPICRELTIPKLGGISVYLDLFGITAEGKLVMIECKLWRNPQARREVVAQALEYASLLRKWSYSDLSVRLQRALGTKADNPLYEAFKAAGGNLDEEKLHDRVARGLRTGDFILIIAGDGIREDLHSIADHLNQNSGMATRLTLVEFQIFEGSAGETVIVPHVPVRTEVLTHRVYLGQDDQPITIQSESEEEARTEAFVDPEGAKRREADKAFWQAFIDAVKFDYPDQPAPRYGSRGFVRIPMPDPMKGLVAYRMAKGVGGLFFTLKGDEGSAVYEELISAKPRLETEIGLELVESEHKASPFEVRFDISYPGNPFDDEAYLRWLVEYANKTVSSLRPLLSQFS